MDKLRDSRPILQDMLRHNLSPLHDDWDEYLDALKFTYHNSWHQSIQTYPFKFKQTDIYGIHPKSSSETEKDKAKGGHPSSA